MDEKEFDRQSLAENDGKDGRPVYIAHNGIVYDVSDSKLWKDGNHMRQHLAGQDLSADFPDAPHGPEVFDKVRKVGTMREEEPQPEPAHPFFPLLSLLSRYPMLRRHPHPMLAHFPIAFMFITPIFALLAVLFDHPTFETTSFHCLATGFLFTLPVIATGLFSWWLNYRTQFPKQIAIKVITTSLLVIVSGVLFVWRTLRPDVLFAGTAWTWLYLLLLFSLMIMVVVIGWFGAEITFPLEKE